MRQILIGLLPLVAALVMIGSLMPERTKHLLGTGTRIYVVDAYGYGTVVNPHRILHWAAFGSLSAISAALATNGRRRAAAGGSVAFMALATEYAEHLIFHNAFEWSDVRDDLGAAGAALILVQAAVWWKRKRESGSMR